MNLNERNKLRTSQQRRLDHACEVVDELIKAHMPGNLGERESAELHMMKTRLTLLIKHQHVIDRQYAEQKVSKLWERLEGEY